MRSIVPSPPSEMTSVETFGVEGCRAPSSAGQRTSIPWAANHAEAWRASSAAVLACAVRDQADRAQAHGPTTASRGWRRRGPGHGVAPHEELDVAVGAAQRRGHGVDHVRPGVARPSRTSWSTARWTSGSRTIPPLPTRARPASNCGFTSRTRSASGRCERASVGRDRDQRDERQVGDGDRSTGPPRSPRSSARTLVRSSTVDTRGSWRSDHASCPRPTSTATTCAAPRCSRQSVNPPVDAPTSSARRPRTSTREARRAGGQLLAAAGDEAGSGRRSAGSAPPRPPAGPGPGGAPPTRTRPATIASTACGGSRATPGARARRRVAGALSPALDCRRSP